FPVAPRHLAKRFLTRRVLSAALSLLFFFLCRIIFPCSHFRLILRRQNLCALQIIIGVNMSRRLHLRGLPCLLCPRRCRRVLRILRAQTTRAHHSRQQNTRNAQQQRHSAFSCGTRDNRVQRHRLALTSVALHIYRGTWPVYVHRLCPYDPFLATELFPTPTPPPPPHHHGGCPRAAVGGCPGLGFLFSLLEFLLPGAPGSVFYLGLGFLFSATSVSSANSV